MPLKSQVLAIVAIPLMALFVIGGLKAKTDWARLKDAEATLTLTENTLSLLGVVHTLQVERGLSAGFLSSKDIAKPTSSLLEARKATDAAIEAVPQGARALLAHLEPLSELRPGVTSKSIKLSEMSGGYSGMIAQTLSGVSSKLMSKDDAKLSQLGAGLVNMTYAKEMAGQQRAAGAVGFAQKNFTPPVYQWFAETGASERRLLDIAELSLTQHLPNIDLRAGLATTGLPDIRASILAVGAGGAAPNMTSKEWFDRATDWIRSLRNLEIGVAEHMSKLAWKEVTATQNNLHLSLVAVGLCAAISLLIALRLIRVITRQFKELQVDMDKLAKKDFDFKPSNLSAKNEVGLLNQSLEQARIALENAEKLVLASEEARIRDRGIFVTRLDEGLACLAEGDLDCSIDEVFPEEYEALRLSFNQSLKHLNSTIAEVRVAAHNITTGAAEISQAADHLSNRTESQATALEETAAALEELTISVESSANGARSVEATMSQARTEAEASGTIVQNAVNAMAEIEKSSEQIARIISVIDDIAFQTNLLALNASVEAARAGEQGRGFAVVASEVRHLALSSAEAATEIKSLIDDSSAQVQNGVDLVGGAGHALDNIVDRVNEISRLVSGIVSGTVEQATNLKEINTNVHQLDNVTQKNAAMVEESTAAGHLLHKDAAKLSKLMAQFNTVEIVEIEGELALQQVS